MWTWDKQETGRAVQLFFVDLENEQEVEQSFFDLKAQLQESKLSLMQASRPSWSSTLASTTCWR